MITIYVNVIIAYFSVPVLDKIIHLNNVSLLLLVQQHDLVLV